LTHSAEPRRPSSSPAKFANRMPRGAGPWRGKKAGEFENARGAGGVVSAPGWIGRSAKEPLNELRRGQMVVVGAKDDIIGLAGEIGEDVFGRGVNSFDVHSKGKN